MALIKCTECGKEFSDRASVCPNCGCPTEVVLEEVKKSSEPQIIKEKFSGAEKIQNKEAKRNLNKEDILTEVNKMKYMLDAVQKTGVWPDDTEGSARKQLRQDLCFFTIFLGMADNRFTKQRYDFIYEVLGFNLDRNDILTIVRDVENENGKRFYDIMVESIAGVILDACDTEDELRNRGMDSNICLPEKIATLFGIVGKAFLGDDYSKIERSAYADYMMNINTFLSEEGYMDGSLEQSEIQSSSHAEEDNGKFVSNNKTQRALFVEEVFTITGKGTVVVGMLKSGTLCIGQKVSWVLDGIEKVAPVKAIESGRKCLFEAKAGDKIGVFLEGVNREEIEEMTTIYILDEYVESMLIDEKVKEIAIYRFGLNGNQEHTIEETAEYFNIPVLKVKLLERKLGIR